MRNDVFISLDLTHKKICFLNETFSTKFKVSLIYCITEVIFNSMVKASKRKTSVFLRMEIILFELNQKN